MTVARQMIKVKKPYRLTLKEAYPWTTSKLWDGTFSLGAIRNHLVTTYNTLAATFEEKTFSSEVSPGKLYFFSFLRFHNNQKVTLIK